MASSEDDGYDYNDASDDGDAYGSDDGDAYGSDDYGCAYDESYESGDVGDLEGIDPYTSELISQEDDDGDCYDSDVVYTDSCDDPDSDHNVVDSDSYDSGVDSHYGSRNIKQQIYFEYGSASKGNSRRAGAGAALESEGLGKDTNNAADYRALNPGTRTALDMGYDRIRMNGNSQLVTPSCGTNRGNYYDNDHNYDYGYKNFIYNGSYDKEYIRQQMERICLEFNGDLKGKPGQDGAGAGLKSKNGTITREREGLGKDMNNSAEYRALNPGIRTDLDRRYDRIHVNEDSQLVTPHQRAEDGDYYHYNVSYCDSYDLDNTQQMEKVYLEFDGASKGNPGRSGAGAVLKSEDGTVITRVCEGLGDATNNEAEYRALIRGLKTARDMGYDRIHVKGDSQLVDKQVKGEWQTRNSRMARYCDDARRLCDQFKEFKISHIPRGQNSDADAEANKGVNLPAGEIQEVANQNYRRRR